MCLCRWVVKVSWWADEMLQKNLWVWLNTPSSGDVLLPLLIWWWLCSRDLTSPSIPPGGGCSCACLILRMLLRKRWCLLCSCCPFPSSSSPLSKLQISCHLFIIHCAVITSPDLTPHSSPDDLTAYSPSILGYLMRNSSLLCPKCSSWFLSSAYLIATPHKM